MLNSLVELLAVGMAWLFAVGMIGCGLFVIPITAYRLFKALFEKDEPSEQ